MFLLLLGLSFHYLFGAFHAHLSRSRFDKHLLPDTHCISSLPIEKSGDFRKAAPVEKGDAILVAFSDCALK